MSMRSLAFALAIGLAIAGCPTSPPPAVTRDVGPRDAASARDANADTGEDAAVVDDAGMNLDDANVDVGPGDPDTGVAPDTGVDAAVDAGPVDAGPTDGGCRYPDGGLDICVCGPPLGMDCRTTACPSGQTCAADACGMHCVPSGAACSVGEDCPAGASCTDGHCAASTCTDSRTCPLGFACEAGACVDRRFPCAADGNCPFGYACDRALGGGTCVRLSRRCASSTACSATLSDHQVCLDIDGDGSNECQFADGICVMNSSCSGGQTCTPRALSGVSSCGRYGVCHDSTNCLTGQQCRDLWGDGVMECVDSGGCTSTASCPAHQVCATPARGGSPVCAGG